MESEDEAKAAIAALDGHNIHGSRITVEVRRLVYWKIYYFIGELVFAFCFILVLHIVSLNIFASYS